MLVDEYMNLTFFIISIGLSIENYYYPNPKIPVWLESLPQENSVALTEIA